MSCNSNPTVYPQNTHTVSYNNCGGCGSCSGCAASTASRVVYEPPVVACSPVMPYQPQVQPSSDSYVIRNPNINSISVADGNGGFYETSPISAGQVLKAFKIDPLGANRPSNLELDFAALEASDIDNASWANLPNGIIPASKINGAVGTGPVPVITGVVKAISVNGGPAVLPDTNGLANLSISTGSGSSVIAPGGITGLTGSGVNKYVGTDSTGVPGIYSLPVAVSGGGITSVTQGFGTLVTTSGGVVNVKVDPTTWVPATTNGGTATNTTELLGKDGKSYKSLDQGESISFYYGSNGQWTCPAGVNRIEVLLIGAGAGQSAAIYDVNTDLGIQPPIYSGQNGSMLRAICTVTPGQTYNFTVGVGGQPAANIENVTNDAVLGQPGGNTSAFGYTVKGGNPPTRAINGVGQWLNPTNVSTAVTFSPNNITAIDQINGTVYLGILTPEKTYSIKQTSVLNNIIYETGIYRAIRNGQILYYPYGPQNSGVDYGVTLPSLVILKNGYSYSQNSVQPGGNGCLRLTYLKGHGANDFN